MALSAPRLFFGVHSFSPYSLTDGTFYGTIKVLKGSSYSLSGTLVDLMGGSSKWPWGVEESAISAELSLKCGQFEDFLFTLYLGKAPTAVSTETTGNVSTLTNFKGTSCKSATIGIASVSALSASETDMKFGKYVVKVASSTTVNVYHSSDADMGRGTNGTMQSDDLKITASALSITTGGDVTVPNYGIKLTGGSGTIGMTTGDTATFYVRPINTGGMTVVVGGNADQVFPEFGAVVTGQKRGNQELVELDIYRCKAAGMPLNFEMGAWAEADIKVRSFYDAALDGVFQARFVKAGAFS